MNHTQSALGLKMMEAHGREGRGDLAGTQGTPRTQIPRCQYLATKAGEATEGKAA